MNVREDEEAAPSAFRLPRRAVRIRPGHLVRMGRLDGAGTLPLLIEPAVEGVSAAGWAEAHRAEVEELLLRHGAILFRNFDMRSPASFEQLIRATCGEPMEYHERSSPRSHVSGNIYTSTDYPPDERIFLHNEQSYNLTFPLRIFFYCEQPAEQGGVTPIADTRKIFNRISPMARARFIEKNYSYVRNFGRGFGLSWQTAFQTDDRRKVEDYCRRNDIEFEWNDENRLRTRQVRRAVARHPRTGELAWFNHLTFFHVSTMSPAIRKTLTEIFRDEDLPNNTYYGDGSPIEPEVLDELRAAYLQETVRFLWQKGDVLMLDNMLTSHGREAYVGPRSVLVGMAEPFSWEHVPTEY